MDKKIKEIEEDLEAFCQFERGDERIWYLFSRIKQLEEAIEKHKKLRHLRPLWHQTHADEELYKVLKENDRS